GLDSAGVTPQERYLLGLDSDGVPYFAVPGTDRPDGTNQAPGTQSADTRLADTQPVDTQAAGNQSPGNQPAGNQSDDTQSAGTRPNGNPPERVRMAGLREAGGLLSDRDAGVFVHAVALANWHAAHPCCARCGTRTAPTDGGHVRRCPSCGAEHFPRTDPAIIVLVADADDRCLLGRQARWPEKRFSTLAGFVEPGEPLEHAVAREVHEETGIEVVDPVYAGSQPWPFPSSLMLGFFARAVTTQIKVDEEEIEEARWLSRAELTAAVDSGELLLPGKVSIARRLIESWYGAELSGDW
ncbi:MAG TPA: NAD(+) diphosphatase, partial [Actinopolymorphaceae bacterium]|nr:NAD(+) diphosphatase [Actinopolymorphaceae bacterium]